MAPSPCLIPTRPVRPVIHPFACGDDVCLTVDDTKALVLYTAAEKEVEDALEGCSLVKRGG